MWVRAAVSGSGCPCIWSVLDGLSSSPFYSYSQKPDLCAYLLLFVLVGTALSTSKQRSRDPCFPLWCLPRTCTPEQPTVR